MSDLYISVQAADKWNQINGRKDFSINAWSMLGLYEEKNSALVSVNALIPMTSR